MADKKIKGITIEIGGDTTKLDQALKGSNHEIRTAQQELIEVEKLLKDNQDSTELQRQKQEALTKSIEETRKKLDILKQANDQVTQSAEKYDDWKAKYEPIKSEIDETKKKLESLRAEQLKMSNSGDMNSEAYQTLQSEVEETKKKLDGLRQTARDVNAEFGNPVSPDQYNAFQREIIKTETELGKLSEQLEETARSAEKSDDSMAGTGKRLSGICDIAKGGALIQVGDQIQELGEKAKEANEYLFNLTEEYLSSTQKAAAYFGETGEAAEETSSVIKDVWLSGVGESMGQVSDAVISVKKNISDLDSQTLSNLTQQAITLDDLYGIDMNETLRGVNSLMSQFGLDAQTAMDYIVAGTQNGLDKTNELGDNLSEYAGKFAQAGYSAQEYFQLLDNGLDSGAYNLDKVNDAINEVTTRLSDGTIGDAIGLYSDETQALFESWTNGNASQKEVIDSIIQDIGTATTQQEALTMASTAFGTMGEDFSLGFVQSLSTLGNEYDVVTGKAQELYDQTSTPQQEMTASIREIQESLIPLGEQLTELALQILPPIADVVTSIISFLSNNPTIANIVIVIGTLVAILGTLIPVVTAVAGAVTMLGGVALAPIVGVIAGVIAAIAAVVAIITNWGNVVDWVSTVWTNLKATLSSAVQNISGAISSWLTNLIAIWTQTWNNIKDTVITICFNIVTGIRERLTQVVNVVKEGLKGAIEYIKSLPSEALKWGSDFIDGFVRGIKDKVGDVADAVKGVGGKVRNFLHFSRPDEGPLRDYETWMPDFMKGLASGIRDNIWRVRVQAQETAGVIRGGVYGNSMDFSGIETMLKDLYSLSGTKEGKNQPTYLVLDSGVLVGQIAPQMDQALGGIQLKNLRGGRRG